MNNVSDDNKKSNSIIIIFLAVILIGVIMGGYYLWQKNIENKSSINDLTELTQLPTIEASETPNEIKNDSDWVTYTNDNFGYSISYPKEFKLSDSCYDNQTKKFKDYPESPKALVIIDRNMDDKFPYCESDFPQMEIIIKAFNQEIDINEMMEQSDTDIEDEVKIGDNIWVRQIMTEPSIFDDSYSTYLFLNINGKGYEINIKNTNANGLHDELIDNIIKTFKIINVNEPYLGNGEPLDPSDPRAQLDPNEFKDAKPFDMRANFDR